jgi:hypothetical protein
MKDWSWQQWTGKLLLLAVALVELLMQQLGFAVPWWMIIGTALTWAAQFFLGLVPGEAWQRVVGKILLLFVSTLGLVLKELGLDIPLWTVLVPMLTALAQYLISLVPAPSG